VVSEHPGQSPAFVFGTRRFPIDPLEAKNGQIAPPDEQNMIGDSMQ